MSIHIAGNISLDCSRTPKGDAAMDITPETGDSRMHTQQVTGGSAGPRESENEIRDAHFDAPL